MYRWINVEKARYYQAVLERDLFDCWTLVLCWGGLSSRCGGMRIVPLASQSEGLALLRRIDKRRARRGYIISNDFIR